MTQFGPGADLAAQCTRLSAPEGWRPWTDADGPIPEAVSARAAAIAADPSLKLGITESYPLPGVVVLFRLEPQPWGRDAQGNLVQGCFRSVVTYLPAGEATAEHISPPSMSKMDKVIGVLTVASLAVGTAATLAAWGKS